MSAVIDCIPCEFSNLCGKAHYFFNLEWPVPKTGSWLSLWKPRVFESWGLQQGKGAPESGLCTQSWGSGHGCATDLLSRLVSDSHKVGINCRTMSRSTGNPLCTAPCRRKRGSPWNPYLKKCFLVKIPRPVQNANVACWGPSHDGHPVTAELESVSNSGSRNDGCSFPEARQAEWGVWPLLTHTFAPSSGGPVQAHVWGHRGGWCGGKGGRKVGEGKSLGGKLGKAFLKRRLCKVKGHKRPRGWRASLSSVMGWKGGRSCGPGRPLRKPWIVTLFQ